jgi:predicted Zn-dependent protease
VAENNHQERVLQTLQTLRAYALQKTQRRKQDISLFYHEEDSYLMRFANSAISLNTNEHLIRLEAIANEGQKRASYELITDLNKIDEMKYAIDAAMDLVEHARPLSYKPTVARYSESFSDDSAFDPTLARISNEERLAYVNQVAAGLESDEIKLSGIFSNGDNILAMINTCTEHTQYFRSSDAQVTLVLAHAGLKWEVIAEGSAQRKSDLDAGRLHQELATLLDHYQHDAPVQLPLGKYDIVFGHAAIAEMLVALNWIGFSGGAMKRGFSFLSEKQVGQKVFSDQFSLTDDPSQRETFPIPRDYFGFPRKTFPIFINGVFQTFTWYQDDADEFGAQPTGHTVSHKSLVLQGGDREVGTLRELVDMPRERDILYIPSLHYMNLVNPSRGVITGSSRFGALLLKQDGSVVVPYNVRLTQSLLDIFGERVVWLSNTVVPYNTSSSYGARNPTAIIVPALMRVNDLEISHSNTSY